MTMISGAHWVVRNQGQRKRLIQHLDSLPFPFACKIGPVIHPKTAKQIRYAHSLCNALAEGRAVPPDIAKRDAKAEFGVVVVSTSIVSGGRTVRLVSFADYTREQMEAFCTQMEAFLAGEGIDFTPAD